MNVPYQIVNKKVKHTKQIENICHFPDVVRTFPNVEYGGVSLGSYLALLFTLTDTENSILLTTMLIQKDDHNISNSYQDKCSLLGLL